MAKPYSVSEEQEELRRTVRAFLEQKSPESEVRRLMATAEGYDRAVWRQMAEQLGLQGLHIPEEHGGGGYSYAELCIVLEEMGRALLPAPYFSSVVLAANALLESGDDGAQREWLPRIAAGEIIATLAATELDGAGDEAHATLRATSAEDGFTLDGTVGYVVDGHVADLVLVAARTSAGLSLFAVDGDAAGLTRTALPTMDMTRKQAQLHFAGSPARLVGDEGGAEPVLERVRDLASVALVNESIGGARFVLEMAVQYAKDRIQFGRPIGSFQVIKHKCADMLLDVESATSAARYAAWCAAEGSDELPTIASLAKAHVGEAYFRVAAENIQIHGGIGFTWEHPAHLYLKRAKSSEILLGDPAHHRELVGQRIGI